MKKILFLLFFLCLNSGCTLVAYQVVKHIGEKAREKRMAENVQIMNSENCRNLDYYAALEKEIVIENKEKRSQIPGVRKKITFF